MTRYRTLFVAVVLAASSYGPLLGTIPAGDTGQWRTAGSLSEPRSGAASVLLSDGAVLVTGGSGPEGSVATADVFGPTGDFSVVAAMRVPRAGHASVVLSDGSVLVVGGRNGDEAIATAERFADGTWTDTEFLTDARWGHTATLLDDGRVLVAGGENGLGSVSSVEVFDPLTNAFSVVGTMTAPRKGHAAARLADGRVIIAGGFGSSAVLASIDVYDPTTDSVTPIATLNVARAGLSATTLIDGRVLFVGGNDGVDDLSSVELFNPVTGTVSLGASASVARRDHQAFLLPNNNSVLIVGGVTPAGATASAELYVPWVGDFRATGSMATARTGATGSPLGTDGRLLVAGGDGLASSDVYAFATIRTDRDDYSPGMTVYVSGTGWLPNENVTFGLRELPAEHETRTFSITADASGRIESAPLFLVEDHHLGVRFYLTARGAASQAQITFTDAQAWALSINPTSVAASSNTQFDLTVTNNSTTANGVDPMGCVVLTVPDQFTAQGTPTVSVPQGLSGWSVSRAGNVITARTTISAERLPGAGQQLTISFNATAPTSSTGSPFTFNVAASGIINCAGGPFPLPTGGQPTVDVTTTSAVTFDATGDSTLSDVSSATPVLSVTVGANPAVSVLKSELPMTFSGIASGTNVSYSYLAPLASTTADKQYRWLSTSGTGSASGQSGQSGGPFTVTSNSTVTATYKAQYLQTFAQTGLGADATGTVVIVDGDAKLSGDLSFSTFVDDGAAVSYSFTDPITSSVDGKRYRRNSVTGPAASYTVSTANIITGNYVAQWQLTLTVTAGVPGGLSHIGGGATATFYDNGTLLSLSATTPIADGVGKRWQFVNWTGDVSSPPNTNNPVSVTMDQARSIDATYAPQYRLSLAITAGVPGGLSRITGGTDGDFYNEGTVLSLAAETPVADGMGKQWRFANWSGGTTGSATPVSVTMDTAKSVTANYVAQYSVSFTQTGIGGDTTATVLTLTSPISATKQAADLAAYSEWFDAGSSVVYAYAATVNTDPAGGKRYALTTAAPAAINNLTAAATVTGTYKTQYKVSFSQTGVGDDTTDTVLTITSPIGMTKTAAQLVSFSEWFDAGSSVEFSYADTLNVNPAATGKKYRLDSVTGPATGYVVDGANTITGNYKGQYLLTLAITPGVPNALTNIGGATTGTFYDEGTVLTLAATTPVADGAGKRWRFDNWSGDVSPGDMSHPLPVTMDQVRSITANYVLQWQLTVAITASVPGGVSANITGGTDGAFYDAGTVVSLTAATPVADGAGKQWRFDNWTGGVTPSPSSADPVSVTMNAPTSVTANYVLQWQLALAITAGVPGGTSSITGGLNGTFYDTGTALTLTAQTPVSEGTAKRWRFDNWTGDVVPSPTGVVPVGVTMTAPMSVTANYVAQYLVTFEQTGINESTGAHTIVTVDGVAKTRAQLISGVSKFVDENGSIAYAFSTPVSTDPISDRQYELTNAASLPTPVTVTSPMIIRGEYTQNTYSILYLRPIDQSTAGGFIINDGKNGRVIPVKVQVFKNGTAIQSGTVIMGLRAASCTAGAASDLVTEYADAGNANGGSNLFRWSSDFWIYNLDTRALGLATNACYRLDVFMNQTNGPTGVVISNATWAVFRPVK
jgi:Galactose oxidase, central domain/Divergent InlB B-repeat domain